LGNLKITLDPKHSDKFLILTDRDVSIFGWTTKKKNEEYLMRMSPWNLADLFKNKERYSLDIEYDECVKGTVEALREELRVYKEGAKIRRFTDEEAIREWELQDFPELFPKIEALPHQMRMVLWLLKVKKGGCYLEQGTGKTPVGILLLGKLLVDSLIEKPLVVAPLDLLNDTVWFKDLAKFSDLKPIDLTNPREFNNPDGNIRFVNPEKFMAWCFRKTEDAEHSYMKDNYFEMFRPDAIFFDEAAALKTHSSYKTMAFVNIARHAKYLALASGCPAPNKVFQYFPQMYVLGSVLGDNYTPFQTRYGVERSKGPAKFWFPVASAERDIRARIDLVSYFVKKDDVLNLLPRKEYDVLVDLHPDHLTMLKTLEKDYSVVCKALNEKGETEEGKILVEHELSMRIKLLRAIDGFTEFTDDDGKRKKVSLPWNAKMDKLDEMIQGFLKEPKNNIIIWCRFRSEVEYIFKKYESIASFVYGGMSKADRLKNLKRYLDNDWCRIMVASSKAVKYGHTWLKANKSFYYSGTDDFEDYTQSRDRNYRYGQDKEVEEYRLVAKKTVEGGLWSGIRMKKRTDQYMKNYYAGITI